MVYNELGPELVAELEQSGCQLLIADDLESYTCTNITPVLQAKIAAMQHESLRRMMYVAE